MHKSRKIVLVKWQDSSARGRWANEKDVKDYEPELITSAGFQVHRTKHKIVVAISYDAESGVADTLTIPMGCVKEIELIRKQRV